MSSDLYSFDASFYHHSRPEMDGDLFFCDPFSPFCDSSPIDNQNPIHNSNSFDNFCLSSSPPSLENLTLCQTTHLQNCSILANGVGDFSGLDDLDVKIEEPQLGFDSSYKNHQSFMPNSYSGVENVAKLMQRSYSSNSFDGKPDFIFQPCFDSLIESPDYQNHAFSSPEDGSLSGQMRRACSTGDLHNVRTAQTSQRCFSSPLASESSFMEEANCKVGRYSAEERKERISKYRAKRNQRNFTKTIKYACRKTLADNRPRIRGRFARNDETGEIPKPATSTRDEDEDELWFDGLHEDEDVAGRGGGGAGFVNSCSQAQIQYYGYGYGY